MQCFPPINTNKLNYNRLLNEQILRYNNGIQAIKSKEISKRSKIVKRNERSLYNCFPSQVEFNNIWQPILQRHRKIETWFTSFLSSDVTMAMTPVTTTIMTTSANTQWTIRPLLFHREEILLSSLKIVPCLKLQIIRGKRANIQVFTHLSFIKTY